MATSLDSLRSPSLPTPTNGIIPHDPPNPTEPQPAAPAFDAAQFKTYLLSLLPPVLGASPDELESIFDDEFEERVGRFAGEGGYLCC